MASPYRLPFHTTASRLLSASSSSAFLGSAILFPQALPSDKIIRRMFSEKCVVAFASVKTDKDPSTKPQALPKRSWNVVHAVKAKRKKKWLRTWTQGRSVVEDREPRSGKRRDVGRGIDLEKQGHIGSDANTLYGIESDSEDNGGVDVDRSKQERGESWVISAGTNEPSGFVPSNLDCQHFPRCSGCVLDTALDKPPIFEDALSFFHGHGIHDLSLTTGLLWEWRCRAKLAVQGTAKCPRIGLYQEGTHNVVDIPSCRAHHPSINMAVELLKEGICELGVQPYDENSGQGNLRYVQMAVTTYNTSIPTAKRYTNAKVQVTLVWNSRSEQSSSGLLLESIIKLLWRRGGPKSDNPILHSIWANFQSSQTNVIFGEKWRYYLGEKLFWNHLGGIDVCLSPACFAQANIQAFGTLVRKLQKHVAPGSAVVELYAGVGIIGLSLAATRSCRTVKCVEVNKEAKASFELSLSRLPKSNQSNISWYCADASDNPINWLMGSDVVVVDPPRKGLDGSVIEALRIGSLRGQGKSKPPSVEKLQKIEKRPWILRSKQDSVQKGRMLNLDELKWPEKLIYVSCSWHSFKLDCAALLDGHAWHLEAVEIFNFFPGTDSIEVLAVFKCGKKQNLQKKKSD